MKHGCLVLIALVFASRVTADEVEFNSDVRNSASLPKTKGSTTG